MTAETRITQSPGTRAVKASKQFASSFSASAPLKRHLSVPVLKSTKGAFSKSPSASSSDSSSGKRGANVVKADSDNPKALMKFFLVRPWLFSSTCITSDAHAIALYRLPDRKCDSVLNRKCVSRYIMSSQFLVNSFCIVCSALSRLRRNRRRMLLAMRVLLPPRAPLRVPAQN
jgi:hypothetical protein